MRETTRKNIYGKSFVAGIMILGIMFSLCGCRREEKYVGTWLGQQGTILVLNDDETCYYKEWDEVDTSVGTWALEDGEITVEGCLDYDIYADCEESDDSMLFQADTYRWNDELFVKSE